MPIIRAYPETRAANVSRRKLKDNAVPGFSAQAVIVIVGTLFLMACHSAGIRTTTSPEAAPYGRTVKLIIPGAD